MKAGLIFCFPSCSWSFFPGLLRWKVRIVPSLMTACPRMTACEFHKLLIFQKQLSLGILLPLLGKSSTRNGNVVVRILDSLRKESCFLGTIRNCLSSCQLSGEMNDIVSLWHLPRSLPVMWSHLSVPKYEGKIMPSSKATSRSYYLTFKIQKAHLVPHQTWETSGI